jgi:hypothetical protein
MDPYNPYSTSELASEYAIKILKKRWIEAERYILKNIEVAIKYALYFNIEEWFEVLEKEDPDLFRSIKLFGKRDDEEEDDDERYIRYDDF